MSGADAAERWNARFAGEDYLFGTEPNAFLVRQQARLRAGMRTLAVADGEGRNGVWLAAQGLEVHSVDVSPVALAKAGRLARERGVDLALERADLADWSWPADRFDLIAAIFIQFAAPAERAAIFAGMTRALAPGGLLLVQGYRPEQVDYGTGGPPQRENMYTAELLRRAFADLVILELRAYDQVVREGRGHDGMSALIELVAQKPVDAPGDGP